MCFVDNCSGTIHARKMCNKHYLQWKVHGKTIAAKAYDAKALELHGEFAKLNFNMENK